MFRETRNVIQNRWTTLAIMKFPLDQKFRWKIPYAACILIPDHQTDPHRLFHHENTRRS